MSKLEKKKRYYFKVEAYRTVSGITSNGEMSTVFQGATRTDRVTDVKKKSNSSSSVKISWKKQSGVTGYRISCYESSGALFSESYTTGNKNDFTVKGLEGGKTYKFRVSSYLTSKAGNSYGPMSKSISMTTKPEKVAELGASTTTRYMHIIQEQRRLH